MKKIIFISLFIFALIFVISCEEDEITTPSYDKHNIQNDSNWVEITDTIHMNPECLFYGADKYYQYLIINDFNTYKNLMYRDSVCYDSMYPFIDFSKKTLLIYNFYHSCDWYIYCHVFRNDIIKKYLFLVEMKMKMAHWGLYTTFTGIIIPKTLNNYKVEFDTLYLDHCW